ncbi:hypothetical protein Tco_0032820 [Tanacetum coccineum]
MGSILCCQNYNVDLLTLMTTFMDRTVMPRKTFLALQVSLKRKLVSFVTENTRLLLTFFTSEKHKDGDGDCLILAGIRIILYAHVKLQRILKHQDSRIMKAQELNDKDFRTNSDIQDLPSKISSLSREIVSKLSR